jgi:phosphoribosyl-ATP pyrophosphohydrolase
MTKLNDTELFFSALSHLASTIDARAEGETTDQPSYTSKLLKDGPQKCAKKLGEEAVETVIALTSEGKSDVANETADLLYHLFVALKSRDISLAEIGDALAKRQGMSGIVEKESRSKD